MNREELRKRLGGYATGNLSGAERKALFTAALEDQELFDALAREQPLADLLEDPAARARLLAALEEAEAPRRRPLWFALAASAVVAVAALVLFLPRPGQREEARPVQVASAPPAAAPLEPAPEAKPKPQPRKKEKPLRAAQLQQEPAAPPPDTTEDTAAAAPRPVLARSNYAAPAENLLRSTLLRQTPDGSYEPVSAELRAGDFVRLRIESATPGYLQVLERAGRNWRPVFSRNVEAGRPYLVPGEGHLRLDQSGRREFFMSVTGPEGQPPLIKRVVLDVK